jgi:hypothetical protein
MLRRLTNGWTRIRARGHASAVIQPLAFSGTLVTLLAVTGCGETRARPAPNVVGESLDAAEKTLDAEGLRYHTVGGGTFGIVVRSHWTVCRQQPAGPSTTRSVTLIVGRSCPPANGTRVPDVVGENLNDAEVLLRESGFQVQKESVDGDPIIVDSLWIVCDQSPEGGGHARTVELYAGHDADECDEYTPW